jgi:hypothetical protein
LFIYKQLQYNLNVLLLIGVSTFWLPRSPHNCKSGPAYIVILPKRCDYVMTFPSHETPAPSMPWITTKSCPPSGTTICFCEPKYRLEGIPRSITWIPVLGSKLSLILLTSLITSLFCPVTVPIDYWTGVEMAIQISKDLWTRNFSKWSITIHLQTHAQNRV